MIRLMIEPYPTFYAGTVAYCVGLSLLLWGLGTLLLALRLRSLPAGISLAAPLVVHVRTPTGSAKDALPQPLIDRYVAAVDATGVISTGHAALEVLPDLYVSHYPAREIDRSPDDFRQLLRATRDNNVPGRFQPSYALEADAWCASTAKVTFERYHGARLRDLWSPYSQDNTYNLTNRNCSSAVAAALESALEGSLAAWPSFGAFLSALVNPEAVGRRAAAPARRVHGVDSGAGAGLCARVAGCDRPAPAGCRDPGPARREHAARRKRAPCLHRPAAIPGRAREAAVSKSGEKT